MLYGFGYTCRLALSVVKKPLIDNGIFSIVDLGLVGSAYFYGYALGKFINGFLADYANIKRFFTFGLIVSGAINISMGINQSLPLWILFWFLNGWVQGIGAPSCAIALRTGLVLKKEGGIMVCGAQRTLLVRGLLLLLQQLWLIISLGMQDLLVLESP